METIKLLNSDEVNETPAIQPEIIDGDLAQVLQDAHELVVGLLETAGFKGYEFAHPDNGYDVRYFVRDGKVIMVDNHQPEIHNMEVLDEEEAKWFLGNVINTFGAKELTG